MNWDRMDVLRRPPTEHEIGCEEGRSLAIHWLERANRPIVDCSSGRTDERR